MPDPGSDVSGAVDMARKRRRPAVGRRVEQQHSAPRCQVRQT